MLWLSCCCAAPSLYSSEQTSDHLNQCERMNEALCSDSLSGLEENHTALFLLAGTVSRLGLE